MLYNCSNRSRGVLLLQGITEYGCQSGAAFIFHCYQLVYNNHTNYRYSPVLLSCKFCIFFLQGSKVLESFRSSFARALSVAMPAALCETCPLKQLHQLCRTLEGTVTLSHALSLTCALQLSVKLITVPSG